MAFMLGMTHKQLIEDIDYEEYLGWCDYFDRRPIGWREDLRTYYLMKSGMSELKQKPEEIFPSIKLLKRDGLDEETLKQTASKSNIMASPFGQLLTEAGIE